MTGCSSATTTKMQELLCTQGLWAEEDSWWPACIHAVLPKGYLELRLEPTATHSEVISWPLSFGPMVHSRSLLVWCKLGPGFARRDYNGNVLELPCCVTKAVHRSPCFWGEEHSR